MSDGIQYSINLDTKPLTNAIKQAMADIRGEVSKTQSQIKNVKLVDTQSASRELADMGVKFRYVADQADKTRKAGWGVFREVKTSAEQAKPPIESLKKEMGGLGAVGVSAAGGLRTFINVAAGIAGVSLSIAGLQSAIASVIRTGGQFETLGATMDSLMGSAQAGQEAMAWIEDFAQKTPLQLDGITNAFIKMRAFGLDPMSGAMESLGDANAQIGGNQESLEGIILAVGKAWSKQKLSQEEAVMLIERGIPVWKLLSDAMGKTETELQEMATAGELGRDAIQALIDEMGRVSKGAMEAQSKTWDGLVSNMEDTWTSFLNTIAKNGTLDYFKDQLQALLDKIQEMSASGELAKMAKDISDKIVSLMQTIKAVIVTIYEWREEIMMTAAALAGIKLLGFIQSLAQSVIGFKAAISAAGGFKAVLSGLSPALAGVSAALAGFEFGKWGAELALVKTGFLDWAYGAGAATDKTAESVKRLEQYQDKIKGFRDLELNLRSEGFDQAADAVNELTRNLVLGKQGIVEVEAAVAQLKQGIDDAKQKASDDQAEMARIEREKQAYRDLVAEKERLEGEMTARRVAREEAQNREAMERNLAEKKQALEAESKAAIDEKNRSLREQQQAEQQAQNEIERIKRNAQNQSLSIEEQLMRIRRESLGGARQEAQLRADIATFTERAEAAMRKGDTDTARDYFGRIQGLTSEIQKTDEKVAALKALDDLNKRIARNEQQQVAAGLDAKSRETQAVKSQSAAKQAAIQAEVRAIDRIMATLEQQREIPVDVEDKQAIERIKQIEDKLAELSKGITIPIKTAGSGAGAVKGYNRGGRIPGYGGGDIVPALVEPGEYVIRKEMVRKYGVNYIEAINRGIASLSAPQMPNITIPSMPRYNTGGLVAGGETQTIQLQIQSGGASSTVRGSRSDIEGLINQLRKLEVTR
jgi:tape measure domain-containing protein